MRNCAAKLIRVMATDFVRKVNNVRALLKDVERVLADGGFLRMTWHDGRTELVSATGESQIVDGRTYQAFTNKHQYGLNRVETGSTESKDLVIEWRQFGK